MMRALLALCAFLAAGLPGPAGADPAVVTCFVNVRGIVDMPEPGVHGIELNSWNSVPLNARVTVYTATRSYSLELSGVPLQPASQDAPGLTPFHSEPVLFRLPTADPIEAAALDFGAEGAGCLTAGYAASVHGSERTLLDEVSAYAAKAKPPVLEAALRGEETPLDCKTPYRAAAPTARKHLGMSADVPKESGVVAILVGLTRDGDVTSLGLLGSSVSRPFEGAALHQMLNYRFEPEIFRCAAVPGGLVYRFHYHSKGR